MRLPSNPSYEKEIDRLLFPASTAYSDVEGKTSVKCISRSPCAVLAKPASDAANTFTTLLQAFWYRTRHPLRMVQRITIAVLVAGPARIVDTLKRQLASYCRIKLRRVVHPVPAH